MQVWSKTCINLDNYVIELRGVGDGYQPEEADCAHTLLLVHPPLGSFPTPLDLKAHEAKIKVRNPV